MQWKLEVWYNVHSMSTDADVLVIPVPKQLELGADANRITGTGEKRCHVDIKATYDTVGADLAEFLRQFNVLTGSVCT